MRVIQCIDSQSKPVTHDVNFHPLFIHQRNVHLIAEVLEIKRRISMTDRPDSVRRI